MPTAPTREEQKGRDSGRIRQEEILQDTEVQAGGVQAKSLNSVSLHWLHP